MKVFIDTNVLISAVLFPNGTAAAAYCKAVTYPCCGMISEYNIEELYEVFQLIANGRHVSDQIEIVLCIFKKMVYERIFRFFLFNDNACSTDDSGR